MGRKPATDLATLVAELEVNRAALAAAQAASAQTARDKERARATQLRAEATEPDHRVEEYGRLIAELEPQLTAAHEQVRYAVMRSTQLRFQADGIERTLGGS